ncbi:MAG: hypothetical protein PHQ35_00955 [Phycisphaerae bacterium]|nr:hypothetical protein [Phycisphaerae bacterium]MDD5381366.1 hypothetical protein [Phycisphaerae bacterium]
MNYLKQTQTKPILPTFVAGKIALSAAEGPIENSFIAGKFAPLFRMSFILRGPVRHSCSDRLAWKIMSCPFDFSAVKTYNPGDIVFDQG